MVVIHLLYDCINSDCPGEGSLEKDCCHSGDWVLDNLDRSHNQSELDQDYPVSHTDDHTTRSNITPWHKPFTVLYVASSPGDSSSETCQWHIVIFTRNYYCGKLWKAGISLNFFFFRRVSHMHLAMSSLSVKSLWPSGTAWERGIQRSWVRTLSTISLELNKPKFWRFHIISHQSDKRSLAAFVQKFASHVIVFTGKIQRVNFGHVSYAASSGARAWGCTFAYFGDFYRGVWGSR